MINNFPIASEAKSWFTGCFVDAPTPSPHNSSLAGGSYLGLSVHWLERVVEDIDCCALRQEIEKILLKGNDCKAKILEVPEANKKLFTLFQGRNLNCNETLGSYLRVHDEQCEAIRDNSGHLWYSLPMARIVADEWMNKGSTLTASPTRTRNKR